MKVKPFVGHTVLVSADWSAVAGAASHVRQIDVLALAANRADLTALCAEVGDTSLDRQLTHPGRRAGVLIGNGWEAMLAVIPEPGRGVYIARDSGHGSCWRVNDDGTFTKIGTWHHDVTRGWTPNAYSFEPVSTRH